MDENHAVLDHLDDRGIAKAVHDHDHAHDPGSPRHPFPPGHHEHNHIHTRHPEQTYDHHLVVDGAGDGTTHDGP